MLLTSVILVLREVLEAALLLSILLAMSQYAGLTARWILIALAGGILGSIAYGAGIGTVSEAFDGMGQELLNAAMQFAIYGLLNGLWTLPLVAVFVFMAARQEVQYVMERA